MKKNINNILLLPEFTDTFRKIELNYLIHNDIFQIYLKYIQSKDFKEMLKKCPYNNCLRYFNIIKRTVSSEQIYEIIHANPELLEFFI